MQDELPGRENIYNPKVGEEIQQMEITISNQHGFHSQAGLVSKLLKQTAKAWKAESG